MAPLIIVFGTTDIANHQPAFPGQAAVYRNSCPKYGYASYSTGKLERSLVMGADVYVCTVLPLFRPEDDWWRALIPAERVFKPNLDARGRPDQTFDHFVNGPWRNFLDHLGRPWPTGVDDALDWRETLDGSDGLLYGGRLAGHTGAAA